MQCRRSQYPLNALPCFRQIIFLPALKHHLKVLLELFDNRDARSLHRNRKLRRQAVVIELTASIVPSTWLFLPYISESRKEISIASTAAVSGILPFVLQVFQAIGSFFLARNYRIQGQILGNTVHLERRTQRSQVPPVTLQNQLILLGPQLLLQHHDLRL
jgi:hypothetical protein